MSETLPVIGVRDKSLTVQGYLDFGSCEIKVFARFNNVGVWELSIPVEHPLADLVRAPGSGIVCFVNDRVISGWTRSAEVSESASDPKGTWVVRGVTDEVLLAARESYPNPAQAANVQTADYYTDSGSFEKVAKELVGRNLGPSALISRRLLSVAADLDRGGNVAISSRFKNVLEELQGLAVAGGNLGFHVFQNDDELIFDVYVPVDRSREIQLDVENGGLESAGWGYEAPSVTRPLVAGQGSGAERTILEVSTPESDLAAAEWGFSIERFKDQRNTDDPAELLQAGLEILSEGGQTGRVISMQPSGSPALKPGTAYWLGDTITVASSAGAAQAQVTEILFSVTDEGLTELITVGDPVGFSFESRMGAKVESQDRRITQLETSAEGGGADLSPNIQLAPGRVGINKAPTQGALDVNGLIYQQGNRVLDSRDSTFLPTDYSTYTPSADYSVYPLGVSVTLVEPNAGWPVSNLYGTLVTHRSYPAGGGTIQYWSAYQSGNSGIYYRQWYYNATSWSAWKGLGIEGLAPNIQFNGSMVGIGKNPALGALDVDGIIRQSGGAGGAYVLDRNYISAGGSGYDSIGTHIPDLNNATYSGWYSYTITSLNKPASENYGTVLVSRGIGQGALASGAWVWQLAFGTGLVRKIYMRNSINGGAWTSWVDLSDASLVTSGTFADARIPNLNASKITAGTFAAARLPASTEAAIGAVERATQAEVNAGTDTTRYVSPAGLRNATYIPRAMAAGGADVTSTGNGGLVTVTFPSGRFSQPPLIMLTKMSGSLANHFPYVASRTATSASIGVFNSGTPASGTTTLGWVAIQMTPSSAAG